MCTVQPGLYAAEALWEKPISYKGSGNYRHRIKNRIFDYQFIITNKCNLHKSEVRKLAQENYISPSAISSDMKIDIFFPNIGKIQLIMTIT